MRLRAEHTDIQQLNWIHLGTVAFFIRIGAHGSRQVHSLIDAAKKVRGELYRVVDPTVYQELDDWEGFDASNPEASPYVRRLVRLAEPRVDSWIYVGNHPLSERLSLSEVSDWRQVGDENGPPEQ